MVYLWNRWFSPIVESNNKCRVNNKHPSCPKTLSNEGCLTTCSNNHNICCYHRKSVGAYRIRPSRRRRCNLNNGDMFTAIILFSPMWRAYALAPYDFPMTQKHQYSHIMVCAIVSPSKMSLQMESIYIPGVNGSSAIGNHGLKSVQKAPATCEMRTVSCAKRLSRPRKWNCSLRKGSRNCENEFAPCAKWLSQPRKWNCSLRKGSRNCENEFAPCAKWLSQPRSWDCPLRKLSSHLPKWNCPSDNGASAIAIGLCTAAQAVHLNCVWIIVVIANACSLWGLKECSSVRLPFAMDMLVFLMKNESAQQSIVITAQTI